MFGAPMGPMPAAGGIASLVPNRTAQPMPTMAASSGKGQSGRPGGVRQMLNPRDRQSQAVMGDMVNRSGRPMGFVPPAMRRQSAPMPMPPQVGRSGKGQPGVALSTGMAQNIPPSVLQQMASSQAPATAAPSQGMYETPGPAPTPFLPGTMASPMTQEQAQAQLSAMMAQPQLAPPTMMGPTPQPGVMPVMGMAGGGFAADVRAAAAQQTDPKQAVMEFLRRQYGMVGS